MAPPLVCPACRQAEVPTGPALLSCPRCRAGYPRVGGLPVMAHPVGAFVRGLADSLGGDPEADAALAPFLPDDAPLSRRLQRTSVAARAHWDDRIFPSQQAAWHTFEPFLRDLPGGTVVELGCGAGRVALEIAGAGREVVALDADPAVIALGEGVRARGRVRTALRTIGASYEAAEISAPDLQGRPVTFLLADALDPPLPPGCADAVVALNLLDNVRVPSTLVGQIDALLRPGGVALLSTPYAWDSQIVEDGERIGGAFGRPLGGRPEDELRRILTADGLEVPWRFELVRDEPHVPWTLVRDARCRFQYDLHVVVARKR